MKCPYCSEEIEDDTTKCPYCAEEIKDKTKKCPYCAEEIKNDAIKCRFCWEELNNHDNNIKDSIWLRIVKFIYYSLYFICILILLIILTISSFEYFFKALFGNFIRIIIWILFIEIINLWFYYLAMWNTKNINYSFVMKIKSFFK